MTWQADDNPTYQLGTHILEPDAVEEKRGEVDLDDGNRRRVQ